MVPAKDRQARGPFCLVTPDSVDSRGVGAAGVNNQLKEPARWVPQKDQRINTTTHCDRSPHVQLYEI